MSIEATEKECSANAIAPRVSLSDIEREIIARYDFTADKAVGSAAITACSLTDDVPVHPTLSLLSICILVMKNGFAVIGKSAPASAANFNAELGRKLAYEDAVRQLWPLMGYTLRTRINEGW